MAGLTLKRTAHARAYSTTAKKSRNCLLVSPRTLTAENACHCWKPAETVARWPHTGQGLKRATGALRGLSALISVAYGMSSIDSTAHGFLHLAAHGRAHKREAIAEASYHERRRTVNDSGGTHLARQAITNSTTELATTAHAPSTGRV